MGSTEAQTIGTTCKPRGVPCHARGAALGAARLEELRSLASGWRWVHRWIAALLLALLALHVTHALLYSESLREVLR